MSDLKRKTETIRHIENLQLSDTLIYALEDASTAESVAEAIDSLQFLAEQWN